MILNINNSQRVNYFEALLQNKRGKRFPLMFEALIAGNDNQMRQHLSREQPSNGSVDLEQNKIFLNIPSVVS